ncbi:uncharacterized protein F4822DRAFT_380618 [Hypoxylon trugodes]|uniref:uncharacterized protein n=1 Tax=Hypoxylon trugodes TaxID=326681 RepID=UPI00218CD40B|nr:uncharacterized protein F4822DRAFT_380618 [Hypoxylon trugodes]KAI1385014.1 hypothetical protein F4822DRAFT_380618 [Hypoxylon trugodes]
MQNSQYGRPNSWQSQYGQPQSGGLGSNLLQHNNYAPPYHPASSPSSRSNSPYQPNQPYYGGPPQTGPYPPPQNPQVYNPYPAPPPGYSYLPPPPPGPPAQGGYPYAQPQHQHQPLSLLLKREPDGSTLALTDPSGRPVYRCIDTHKSSMSTSARPDYVIVSGTNPNDEVGAIRYHRWASTSLDYWAVRGVPNGNEFWSWRVDTADAAAGHWKCYRAADLEGGRDPKIDHFLIPIASMTYDWKLGKKVSGCGGASSSASGGRDGGGIVIGRCDLFDAGLLLNPGRRVEMEELVVTAVVTMDTAAKSVARAKERGDVKDWAKFAKRLDTIADLGGFDGSGGDGGGGAAGDGGGGAVAG